MTRVHDIVYTICMKNITFSAKEELIEKARKAARDKNRTLNELFREWLKTVSDEAKDMKVAEKLEDTWNKTSYLRVGKKLSRNDMNER